VVVEVVRRRVGGSRAGSVGMFAFSMVCVGQVFSLLGTAMKGFALAVWAWEVTGQATALAVVGFFGFAPVVLVSPVAGALVDRWNRKLTMMLSDFGLNRDIKRKKLESE